MIRIRDIERKVTRRVFLCIFPRVITPVIIIEIIPIIPTQVRRFHIFQNISMCYKNLYRKYIPSAMKDMMMYTTINILVSIIFAVSRNMSVIPVDMTKDITAIIAIINPRSNMSISEKF